MWKADDGMDFEFLMVNGLSTKNNLVSTYLHTQLDYLQYVGTYVSTPVKARGRKDTSLHHVAQPAISHTIHMQQGMQDDV